MSGRPGPSRNSVSPVQQMYCHARPGHVGDDVLLELSGLDRDDVSLGVHHRAGGALRTVPGRLPREPGAGAAVLGGVASGRLQSAQAVLEHRAGRFRVGRGQGRQDEDVGVPEDMPRVTGPGQPSRAQRRLPAGGHRGQQLEQGVPGAQLRLGVSGHINLAVIPQARPRRAVLGQQLIEAEPLGDPQPVHRTRHRGRRHRIGQVCRQTLDGTPSAVLDLGLDGCRDNATVRGAGAADVDPVGRLGCGRAHQRRPGRHLTRLTLGAQRHRPGPGQRAEPHGS